MTIILNIIIFVLILGVIITIHELGHFYFAKKAGVLCHEFSFGMGPLIYKRKKGETQYSIRAIPIGGYVAMAGEQDTNAIIKSKAKIKLLLNNNNLVEKIILRDQKNNFKDLKLVEVVKADLLGTNNDMYVEVIDEDGFTNKYFLKEDGFLYDNGRELQFSPYKRCLDSKSPKEVSKTLLAGPFSNFILGFLILVIAGFFVGKPNLDSSVIGEAVSGYPAYTAGIRDGDIITSINDQEVESWYDLSSYLSTSTVADGALITYERDNVSYSTIVYPKVYIYSLGISNKLGTSKVIIDSVSGTIAEAQGLVAGDEIISVNQTNITSWEQLMTIMEENTTGDLMTFVVRRNQEEITLSNIDPYSIEIMNNQNVPIADKIIGVNVSTKFNLLYSLEYSFKKFAEDFTSIFDTIRLLVTSDEVGVTNLSGPVGIYSMTSAYISAGFASLMNWTAFLSINIGILNLLPIPALDGGQLMFVIIESIIKKKLPRALKNNINNFVYLLLMVFMIFITFNDILRFF